MFLKTLGMCYVPFFIIIFFHVIMTLIFSHSPFIHDDHVSPPCHSRLLESLLYVSVWCSFNYLLYPFCALSYNYVVNIPFRSRVHVLLRCLFNILYYYIDIPLGPRVHAFLCLVQDIGICVISYMVILLFIIFILNI